MKPPKPETRERNAAIYQQHQAGLSAAELAQRYLLEEMTVWKIIWKERRNESILRNLL